MADGFLGRWSRRKLDAKEGKPLEEPVAPAAEEPSPQPSPASGRGSQEVVPSSPLGEEVRGEGPAQLEQAPPPPPPTLEDAQSLTPESDFRRFVARDVSPDVRNTAMKKLFADPRYNIQDGLDVYIDDYSKPDPMPESMLRSLVSAQFLGLFREEERKDEPASGTRDAAEELAPDSVAQSAAPQPDLPTAPPADHADPDLRLQQDHAPPGQEPGHGTG